MDAEHVTTIEGPDSAGHWSWRCTSDGCYREETGFEFAAEVTAAATIHGPLAADSITPTDENDDDQGAEFTSGAPVQIQHSDLPPSLFPNATVVRGPIRRSEFTLLPTTGHDPVGYVIRYENMDEVWVDATRVLHPRTTRGRHGSPMVFLREDDTGTGMIVAWLDGATITVDTYVDGIHTDTDTHALDCWPAVEARILRDGYRWSPYAEFAAVLDLGTRVRAQDQPNPVLSIAGARVATLITEEGQPQDRDWITTAAAAAARTVGYQIVGDWWVDQSPTAGVRLVSRAGLAYPEGPIAFHTGIIVRSALCMARRMLIDALPNDPGDVPAEQITIDRFRLGADPLSAGYTAAVFEAAKRPYPARIRAALSFLRTALSHAVQGHPADAIWEASSMIEAFGGPSEAASTTGVV